MSSLDWSDDGPSSIDARNTVKLGHLQTKWTTYFGNDRGTPVNKSCVDPADNAAYSIEVHLCCKNPLIDRAIEFHHTITEAHQRITIESLEINIIGSRQGAKVVGKDRWAPKHRYWKNIE